VNANELLQRFGLHGRKAVVTGASSGLGRHFASVLAAAGAEVFACARRIDRLDSLVQEITAAGGLAHAVVMDVTNRSSVCAALDVIDNIDILINNAGVSDTKRVLDYSDADWDAIVDTNLKGTWVVAQETARRMAAANIVGSIINITSILGTRVAGGLTPYIAAKAGLKQLTQSLALELARYNIRVNSIAPGYVVTELNGDFLSGAAGEKLKARIPSQRFGTYEDLNGALLLLASPASAYMTGSEIVVDGGHLCSGL